MGAGLYTGNESYDDAFEDNYDDFNMKIQDEGKQKTDNYEKNSLVNSRDGDRNDPIISGNDVPFDSQVKKVSAPIGLGGGDGVPATGLGGGSNLDSEVPTIPLAGGAANRRRLGAPNRIPEKPKERFDYLNFGKDDSEKDNSE